MLLLAHMPSNVRSGQGGIAEEILVLWLVVALMMYIKCGCEVPAPIYDILTMEETQWTPNLTFTMKIVVPVVMHNNYEEQ